MKVNRKTMLFEELTDIEKQGLLNISEKIVLKGEIPPQNNIYVSFWMKSLGYTDEQFLLLISTVFPQRALLSLIK